MVDRLTPERRSWLMSRIRDKDTQPEIALRHAMHALGLRGWRLHPKVVPGRPDIAFTRWKLAIFVDGAFWHGHPSKFRPGRLSPQWESKITNNRERDRRVDEELRLAGWVVCRIWDFDVREDPIQQAVRVRELVVQCRQTDGQSEAT
jgi:DNA mismatch endonuclease, patch repair protein